MDIIFTPSLSQTDKTETWTLSTPQVSACQSFIDAQNAGTPGKYPTFLSLIVRNLKTGVLHDLQTTYPPQSEPPVAVSGIQIDVNMGTFSDNEVKAASSFVRDQNAAQPGKYNGVGHLLSSTLQTALLATVVQMCPSSAVTTALATQTAAEAAYAAAVAAANELPYNGTDPVTITPYA